MDTAFFKEGSCSLLELSKEPISRDIGREEL